ncbi:ABC transporter permease subunit [Adlercreutzia murintestinalis]|uniref:ABC transporter permease subunit n=1 Tax=Adlercreutzia murintestinalis TaxID=2941325 RepID=UPI00203F6778|nr:ABC transporter permease subunit [Adlercreutzia murintestinalis]
MRNGSVHPLSSWDNIIRGAGVRLPLLLLVGVLVALAGALAVCALPVQQAQALTTERFTAKSNQDGADGIMGATDTRITWQGQADEGESVSSVTITLPEGSVLPADGTTVTVLDGLKRLSVPNTVDADGTSVTATFDEPTPAGSMVMLEFNNAQFPAEGGTFAVQGSYTLADGSTAAIPDAGKTITVTGTTPSEQMASWLNDQPWVQAWNSNKFLHLFFDPAIVVTTVPAVFWGWLLALALVAISFPLAIPLGLCWSFLRMANNRFARAIGSIYINVVRGTPLFLQIYIAFFGLPLLGIQMDNFVLGVVVLVMNSSAYLAEIFRAGIQSINKGQFEAARSLGMNGAQTMIYVIIPQTFRRVIPTMTSEFILMYKDTSLLAAVGVMEIMMYSKTITAATGNVTPYIVAACFYLIVTIPLTKVINHMEVRLAGGRPKHRKANRLQEQPHHDIMATVGAVAAEGSEAAVAKTLRMSESFAHTHQVHAEDSLGKKMKDGRR